MKKRILLSTLGLSLTTVVLSLWGTEYVHEQRAQFNYLTLVVLGLLLILYALVFGKARLKIPSRMVVFIALPLLASLTFLDPLFRFPDSVMLVVSLAGGVGMLPLVILWTRSYSGMSAKTVAISVGFALIINHVIHLMLILLPISVYAVATALLPMLSSLLLFLVSGVCQEADLRGGCDEPDPKHLGRFVAATVMANVALSFIYMLYRVPSMNEVALAQLEIVATLARIGLLLVVVLVFSAVVQFRMINYYRFIIVFGVFGFLSFPILGNDSAVPYVLTATSFTCLGILMWVFPICYSLRNKVSSDYVIGVAYGPFVALWAITYFVAEYLLSPENMDVGVLNIITLVGAGLVVLAYTVVFTDRDMLQALPLRDDLKGINVRTFVEEEQLEAIASTYAMTEREQEVFAKLFAGKSRAQIRDELYISEGTLNSHTRNIYRKTGVHNRQELVALVRKQADS